MVIVGMSLIINLLDQSLSGTKQHLNYISFFVPESWLMARQEQEGPFTDIDFQLDCLQTKLVRGIIIKKR